MKNWFIIIVIALIASSCYNDKFEALHPLDGFVNTCDTTVAATYTASISYILSTNCISCHNNSNSSGNINLTTYGLVQPLAQSGKLVGVITHASGYTAMPPGGTIKDCDVNKIKLWIDQGTPEQ
jgi:cytochrome c5